MGGRDLQKTEDIEEKTLLSHHKEALQRWPISKKPSDDLPEFNEEDSDEEAQHAVLQSKLVKAISKFRSANPALRETTSLVSFLAETDALPAKLLHGLIVEMEVDEIVTKASRKTLVTHLLMWLARTGQHVVHEKICASQFKHWELEFNEWCTEQIAKGNYSVLEILDSCAPVLLLFFSST